MVSGSNLLKADEFRRYVSRPELLREDLEAAAPGSARQIVIDEVQKVPPLLDEVHWLIENRGLRFALCGSSARKVRRGAANLLGGRALRYELRGLTAGELGDSFDLDRALTHGYLPSIYASEHPRGLLDAYIADYLRQEVAAEGLVRNLPAFSEFLDAAALSDGDPVNYSSVARECGVSGPTAKAYFGILEDTLLARRLPAWRRRVKRRLLAAPKLYFEDVGVVNRLARRGEPERGSDSYGKAFENWMFHELSAYVAYRDLDERLTYWRLPSGIEVDFVLGDMRVAIEAKASVRVVSHHLRGLRTPGRGAPRSRPQDRRLPRTARPEDQRRHRHPPGHRLRPAPVAGRPGLTGRRSGAALSLPGARAHAAAASSRAAAVPSTRLRPGGPAAHRRGSETRVYPGPEDIRTSRRTASGHEGRGARHEPLTANARAHAGAPSTIPTVIAARRRPFRDQASAARDEAHVVPVIAIRGRAPIMASPREAGSALRGAGLRSRCSSPRRRAPPPRRTGLPPRPGAS